MDIFFFVLKETYYAHFYNIYASGVPSEVCLWSFSWKYPTDNLLYHFENAYFEWKQKRAVFMHVSLNVNEMLFNDGCGFTDTLLKKKHLFGFDYHIYCAKIMHFKPYTFFDRTHPKRTHSKWLSHGIWVLK